MTDKKEKGAFVSTNTPLPPQKKSKILTTHDLPDPADVEERRRRDAIMEEAKKEKEKK